ncbi:DUF4198 domain-containing protein [uncultured Desulfobacter sp.]|uniref:DUF4198 domain-containing protein n=1 Tax=uncultured Desulfobacter sp. TaxID=240139 RepID=UPI002AA6971A|nr:DUF4198 domain-containing protein [uncultured Desulfobacter sp.]
MRITGKIAIAAAASLFMATTVYAHSFWVSIFESFSHKPGHVLVGLGWGHTLPIDDILNSSYKVPVESFTVTDPGGKTIQLKIPSAETATADKQTPNLDLFSADIGLQKIALKKESIPGVYKIEARSKPAFYTRFIDKKDRMRLKMKSKDQIKNIKKVLMSMRYQANAVSYVTLKKWETPEPTNQGLEIIPMTDLSQVKPGDLVKFKVLFMGKPLNSNYSPQSSEFITASTPAFDKGQHFKVYSKIWNGDAKLMVQCPGKWLVKCSHKGQVDKEGPLKDLYGKADLSSNEATLTFNVN